MADLRKCDGCGKTAPQSKYGPDITEDGWYRLIGTAPKGEYAPKWWACSLYCLCAMVFSMYNVAPKEDWGAFIDPDNPPCRCGHPLSVHRNGSDQCGICGECLRFADSAAAQQRNNIGQRLQLDDEAFLTGDNPREVPRG